MPRAAKPMKRVSHRPPRHKRGYDHWWYRNSLRWLAMVIAHSGDPWCRICHKRPATEVDHIIPPSRSHQYGTPAFMRAFRDMSNWQPACAACNSAKQNRDGRSP